MENKSALIWMSAGNSYFTEEVIDKLLKFADKRFNKIIITSPDKPAEHTFRALGYPNNKASRKAKLNSNLLLNRAKRIINKLENKNKFIIVDWEKEIISSLQYKLRYKEIYYFYNHNDKFREDCRKTTLEVIKKKLDENIDYKKALDDAVLYLLEELAFVLSCNSIYNTKEIYYLYHQHWKVYENLIAGKYDGKERKELYFLLTKI